MVVTYIVCLSLGNMTQSAPGREYFLGSQTVAVAFGFFHLGNGSTNETAIVLLQIVKLRQCIASGQSIGIASIDTRDEGVNSIIDERLAQTSASQSAHTLVGVGTLLAPGFTQNTELICETEQRSGQSANGIRREIMETVALPYQPTF